MLSPTAESNIARDRLFAELTEWVRRHPVAAQSHRYGQHPAHVADLRLPTGNGPHPVVVLVHGGNWRAAFTKATVEAVAIDLVQRGWATWNIEFRGTGNGGGARTTNTDVQAAIRALDGLPGVDHARVIVLGHSSGGQLALRAAQRTRVAAVVSLSGYCDLHEAARLSLGDHAVQAFCGGDPDEVPDEYEAADPIRHLPLGRRTLLVHGTEDDRVPASQSTSYATAAGRAGDPCELLLLPGVGHFEVLDPRSPHWHTVADVLPELLGDPDRPKL